ncbi:hypothetical protein H8356DRAFT_965633 [Neocallimastix lanati (nom. inval.)]|jgi:ankyrin repeat protein|uniref:Ankyrin n=1 Tax=Neocallimastix californiae TaxID=1754190 RepID=A0A1Y2ALX7_9FUNG|nr:hypothetical protein H8356DRAFT_965633 [Neocallimastix sp. JGI-2020a]ORY23494.1 hypothetical protein LY90DRAFT_706846 [Neocallimastix californiae]|eukprot:ORY23494.1 hypothetical protein LY90DRAFT_706846 [Neocallimastix californiae]
MELTEVVKRHYYLVYACENGNLINVEKKLINNSADINIANNNGINVLMLLLHEMARYC